jgi:indole-3-glycerol phosphate synthase
MSGTILDQIIAHKRSAELPSLPPVDRAALVDLQPCRGFRAALQRHGEGPIRVIAESKQGSPSKGVFTKDYDPVRNALFYVAGGAACISVLTDERFFYGHLDHLVAVRAAVDVPLIRKDFVVDQRQIAEARLVGADCILLIVACLEDGLMEDLHGFARELGLDVLVEVHDADEAARALSLGADLVGVNNRDLKTFATALETTFDLLPGLLGGGRVVVSESGIESREQCRRLEGAKVDAILVGETLMRAQDPAVALQRLRGTLATF